MLSYISLHFETFLHLNFVIRLDQRSLILNFCANCLRPLGKKRIRKPSLYKDKSRTHGTAYMKTGTAVRRNTTRCHYLTPFRAWMTLFFFFFYQNWAALQHSCTTINTATTSHFLFPVKTNSHNFLISVRWNWFLLILNKLKKKVCTGLTATSWRNKYRSIETFYITYII